jgi:hypothetical protein
MVDKINKLTGIKELDTGISRPSQWNLVEDQNGPQSKLYLLQDEIK